MKLLNRFLVLTFALIFGHPLQAYEECKTYKIPAGFSLACSPYSENGCTLIPTNKGEAISCGLKNGCVVFSEKLKPNQVLGCNYLDCEVYDLAPGEDLGCNQTGCYKYSVSRGNQLTCNGFGCVIREVPPKRSWGCLSWGCETYPADPAHNEQIGCTTPANQWWGWVGRPSL